jgi:hypothetical protein
MWGFEARWMLAFTYAAFIVQTWQLLSRAVSGGYGGRHGRRG